MSVFKAYDIRGIAGKELNAELAYRIGYYLPALLNAGTVLVGRDARESSPELHTALVRGILDAGADVSDAGLVTTPMLYYASGKLGFKASVQLTASHNPAPYNGLKISGEFAIPVGYDDGLNKLERLVKEAPGSKKTGAKRHNLDIKEEYLEFIKKETGDYQPAFPLVMDTSNGMGGLIARDLFGDRPVYLNEEVDGRFPAHEPNPLDPASRGQLVEAVRGQGAMLGMIFDGDADRVMFVDESGKFIPPDLMIALLGHHFLEGKGPHRVLQDIRSSRAVEEYLKRWQADVVTWKVGRAFAARKLRAIDGIYGGELAGHYYFRDFFYSDSGMLAALLICKVLEELTADGRPVSAVISRISQWKNSGEINFRVNEKDEALQKVVNELPESEEPERILDFDGYRLDFKDWWFNIRKSNTEPFLRFIVESRNAKLLDHKIALASSIISNFN